MSSYSRNKLTKKSHWQPENRHALIKRVRAARTRVGGIIIMIEGGRPCGEILQEAAAIQAALQTVRRQLIRNETLKCLEGLHNSESPEQLHEIVDQLLAISRI